MDSISSSDITEIIRAGRISEARTLLTLHGATFSPADCSALEQELEERQAEAVAKAAQAEALEMAGHIDEAKAMYETVLTLAVDYPGVHSHINRLNESLSLTKAVRRRGQRRRVVAPPGRSGVGKKMRPWPWLGAGLAAALFLLFLFRTPSPPPSAPMEPAIAPPAGSAARADGPEPTAQPHPIPSPPTPAPRQEEKPPGDRLASAAPLNPQGMQTAPADPAPTVPAQAPMPTGETVAQPPAPPLTIPPEADKTPGYRVRKGDSLISIARQLFCDPEAWRQIHNQNRDRISDPNLLKPGMQLQLDGIANRCPTDR